MSLFIVSIDQLTTLAALGRAGPENLAGPAADNVAIILIGRTFDILTMHRLIFQNRYIQIAFDGTARGTGRGLDGIFAGPDHVAKVIVAIPVQGMLATPPVSPM